MGLSDDQFRATVVGLGDRLNHVFSSRTHLRAVISVQHIKEGDLFKHVWQSDYPYQVAAGPSRHDPNHPAEGKHFVIPTPAGIGTGGRTTPHSVEGTKMKVIRQRRNPREDVPAERLAHAAQERAH